jgi:hypothetical protein
MKLIIQGDRIAATATDAYTGPDAHIAAPEGFTADDMGRYIVQGGELVEPVPEVITPRQAKIALLQAGLLDDVEAGIAAIPDETTRRIAQVEWEYAQEVRRDWPLLNDVAAAIGLTAEQVDELFQAAARI